MMEEIGARIKETRKKAGMSLKALAEKVDTTSSFLSQVENNKTAISLTVLKKIALALNTSMAFLLGEIKSEKKSLKYHVVKQSERRVLKNIGNGLQLHFLSTFDSSHLLEPTIHVLEPNTISGIPPYQHEGEEIIFILKGEIIFHLADQNIEMTEGDSCYFDSSIEHSFETLQQEGDSRILCVSSQAYFD